MQFTVGNYVGTLPTASCLLLTLKKGDNTSIK